MAVETGQPSKWTEWREQERRFFATCIEKRAKGAIGLDGEDLVNRQALERPRWEKGLRAGETFGRARRGTRRVWPDGRKRRRGWASEGEWN